MADNTVLNAGTGGDTMASDDIGGIKHQRVKLSVGADGSASDAVPVSNGMDVTGAAVQAVGLVAQLDDTATSAVTENQFAPVRLSSRRALLVEGVASGTVIPVSDGGGNLSIDDGGNVISVDWNGTAPPIGAGTEAAALRVTVATDSTGVLSVDDNGGSLTVDGTITAAQATAANLNCTEASAAAIKTAVEIMDDWDNAASDGCSVSGDVAHDGVDAGEPVKVGGRADTTFQAAVADGDRVAALFDVYGVQSVRSDHPNKWSYHEDSSSALTDATVQAAPGAGLSVYITDIMVSIGAATALNVFLEEGASKILGPYYLEAVNGRSLHVRFKTPKKATANTAITVTTSAAIAHGLDILGFIAP